MEEKAVIIKEEEIKNELSMSEEEKKSKKEKEKKKFIKMNYAELYIFLIQTV